MHACCNINIRRLGVQDCNEEILPLQLPHQDGYTCVCQSSRGVVYIPTTALLEMGDCQFINDVTFHPKLLANEVLLTPVIFITSSSKGVPCADRPAIIEFMKTTELCDSDDKVVVPMFSSIDLSVSPQWTEFVGGECVELEDSIRFTTTHLSFFTAIILFPPPSMGAS